VVGAAKVKAALDLAEKVGDTRVIAPVLAKNVGLAVDDATRSRIAVIAARHYVQESEYGIATGILLLVKKESPAFLEAEALRGVVLANQGRYNDALAPLLTAQALGAKAEKGDRFDNMVTLNVARSYYGAGNYPRAVEYYAKVQRGSDFWVEAWFEKAWSHFRADDMNGTLSTLMAHDSPFLRDWYEPEADLLRAYAYFLMCKFKDATAEITAFEERYRPIFGQVSATTATYTAADGWNDFLALTQGKDTKLYRPVIVDYATDERMLGAKGAVDKANEELDRLANVSANAFATRATETLKARKAQIQDEEGARLVKTGVEARDELKELLANIQITRLDMMQFETAQLERQSVTGVAEVGDRIGQLRKLKSRPGMRAWPWQGEYWADEVGYYQVLARPDCPDALRPKAN
jgi:tetratricopeptide (TPR) repeat protein